MNPPNSYSIQKKHSKPLRCQHSKLSHFFFSALLRPERATPSLNHSPACQNTAAPCSALYRLRSSVGSPSVPRRVRFNRCNLHRLSRTGASDATNIPLCTPACPIAPPFNVTPPQSKKELPNQPNQTLYLQLKNALSPRSRPTSIAT